MKTKSSWKQRKLEYMATLYGKSIDEFRECKDDRRVFFNTYCMIVNAVISLPDNPDNYVCVAMNAVIREDTKMMNEILVRFGKKEAKQNEQI